MGQTPCTCSSQCAPLMYSANKSVDTVTVDKKFFYEIPELEADGQDNVSECMESMPRCPRRLSEDAQTLRLKAMAQVADSVAAVEATEQAKWQTFEEKIRREIQAQLEDEERRRQRKKVKQEEEQQNKAAQISALTAKAVEIDANIVGGVPAVAEVGKIPEEVDSAAVAKSALATACVTSKTGAVQQAEFSMKEVTKFLATEKFKSVTSSKRKMLHSTYPLHVAVARNDASLVRGLLAARADASQRSRGQTPWQLAETKNLHGSHDDVLAALNSVM